MIEGYLIADDASGNILPVTAVLAQDQEMDAAILRVQGGNFTPLPLNDQTAPGDTVYVFSDPMGAVGYFSSGMLNRFFWFDGRRSTNAAAIDGARNLCIHVSADWAPASSGAALMDCGNAIGHVSAIDPQVSDDPLPPPEEKPMKPGKKSSKSPPPPPENDNSVLIILHEAVPARGVKLLAESMNAAAPAPAK